MTPRHIVGFADVNPMARSRSPRHRATTSPSRSTPGYVALVPAFSAISGTVPLNPYAPVAAVVDPARRHPPPAFVLNSMGRHGATARATAQGLVSVECRIRNHPPTCPQCTGIHAAARPAQVRTRWPPSKSGSGMILQSIISTSRLRPDAATIAGWTLDAAAVLSGPGAVEVLGPWPSWATTSTRDCKRYRSPMPSKPPNGG